jgi:molybdenum cofactor cytidylyltransferase
MPRPEEKVAGVVLAAGASTRMGSLKQLLPMGHETLIELVLGQILATRLDAVVLVLGHGAREIRAVLAPRFADPRLHIVHNPRYGEGISTSIRAGIQAVEGTHGHAMLFLADMPRVPAGLIDRLIDRHLTSGALISAIKAEGRPSHPVVFRQRVYLELKHLKGDKGARDLVRAAGDSVCLIEPGGDYDTCDIDTTEDYLKFQTP